MQDTQSTTHKAKRGRLLPATTSSSYFTVRQIPLENLREGQCQPIHSRSLYYSYYFYSTVNLSAVYRYKFKRGALSLENFRRRARYLKFSYQTKQAKRKWRHAHATTRAILLDKPHAHFIAHHRHNDSQLLGTHLRAPNLSRNISLQRLAIRTRGAVISRPTLPLTVHTTIEHLPATSTPNLKHLLQRAWISVTV